MSKEGRISTQEMVQYRERLIKQKEFLTEILSKIEKQMLALQVERLHLRNTLLGTKNLDREILPDAPVKDNRVKIEPVTNNHDQNNLMEQQLDLSMPPLNVFEEEIEDDEITEDEKQILNQLDFLI